MGTCNKWRFQSTVGINIQVLGLGTSRLIGQGLSNHLSDQVRAKVMCCKTLKTLTILSLDQWLLNHQDPVIVSYGMPPTANRWPLLMGITLCRVTVGIFYSPSWQGEMKLYIYISIYIYISKLESNYSPSSYG